MDIPSPPHAVVALASFVVNRFVDASSAIAPVLVSTAAATPFAPNSYSRIRLIRQMHASGLLADDEVPRGVPRAG